MLPHPITPNIYNYAIELRIDAAPLVPPSTLQLSVLEQVITRACTQLHTLFDQTMGQTVDAMPFINNDHCGTRMWNDDK